MKVPNQEKIRALGGKEILWNIGSWHHQTSGDERKIFKRVSQENQKAIHDKTIPQKSFKTDKYLGFPTCNILGTILKVD